MALALAHKLRKTIPPQHQADRDTRQKGRGRRASVLCTPGQNRKEMTRSPGPSSMCAREASTVEILFKTISFTYL